MLWRRSSAVCERCSAVDCCSLYDSDISQDWYSPSYSPPDHAYTPTGDMVDDYPSDYDYGYDYNDDDDWRYDNRPRGTGRKLPAPPPTTDYSWQTPTPTINGDYSAPPPGDAFTNTQQSRPADTAPPLNGYADDLHRDYADYNGYYDAVDDYYDGSDGYDRSSEMYDDRYYMSFDGEYGDGLVNGYADDYKYVQGSKTDSQQPMYYDYDGKAYDAAAAFQQSSQYAGTERGTDVDQQPAQYQFPPPSLSPAVHAGDVDRRTPHDAIYDDGYVDRDGVYHHYDDRRYDDERYYGSGAKYVASIPSDAGESAYDVDELAEEVLSSVPARSSIDSSATPAVRYDRYYDGKTDSFESYDRDSTAYDATTGPAAMKDSGYQTFNQQQSLPSEPEPPYFNHVDVTSWPQPAAVNGDVVLRSPVTIIDAQAPRQSFHVSHPAENTFAPSADQRWPVSSPPVTISDGLSSAPAPAGFCDTAVPTSAVEPTSIGY